MMNFVQILDGAAGACDSDVLAILAVVKFILNAICVAVPIILIVLIVLDLAKIVTAGNLDDKMKKEVTNKVVTRIIFAILIFLVPTVVKLVFGLLPLPVENSTGEGSTWRACWDGAKIGF
jgi:hypothetical protein